MVCAGPKGSVAHKFFDIDDALLETTQAELAIEAFQAPSLCADDILKHSVFRMSARYADEREADDRRLVVSDLGQYGRSDLLKGTKLTFASATLREAMQTIPDEGFMVCHASCAALTRASEFLSTVSVVDDRGNSMLQNTGFCLLDSSETQFVFIVEIMASGVLEGGEYLRPRSRHEEAKPKREWLLDRVRDATSEAFASCNGEPMRPISLDDTIEEAEARLGTSGSRLSCTASG
jgi:hypothetical protein